MARDRVTSVDVAARAGVSQSAVSRVFTPGASASRATAAKVRKAAEELGYRPNVLARSLITGQSRIIGLVVAYLDNQFYPDALQRLSESLQARGYHILVFLASGASAEVEEIVSQFMDYQVDGIVTASVGLSDALAGRCEDAGIPVVLFNRGQEDPRLSQVTSDNLRGGREIARYLVAGGHSRIAQITGWTGSTTGRDRERGFREGLAEAGLAPVATLDGRFERDAAAAAARSLFAGPVPPDAIFVGNDHMAFAVLDTLRHDLGLRVPDEVSVIGYDDVALAAWASYSLTTWRQPSGRMIEATVDILMQRLHDPEAPVEKIAIDGWLVERGSARRPKDTA